MDILIDGRGLLLYTQKLYIQCFFGYFKCFQLDVNLYGEGILVPSLTKRHCAALNRTEGGILPEESRPRPWLQSQ